MPSVNSRTLKLQYRLDAVLERHLQADPWRILRGLSPEICEGLRGIPSEWPFEKKVTAVAWVLFELRDWSGLLVTELRSLHADGRVPDEVVERYLPRLERASEAMQYFATDPNPRSWSVLVNVWKWIRSSYWCAELMVPHLKEKFRRVLDDPSFFDEMIGLPRTPERLEAFYHVLTRKPKRGGLPRWEQAAAELPMQFQRGWLRKSILGESRRVWKRNRNRMERRCIAERVSVEALPLAGEDPCEKIDRARVQQAAAAAGLSPGETEVALAYLARENLAAWAQERGKAPSTAYNLLLRARRKVPALRKDRRNPV